MRCRPGATARTFGARKGRSSNAAAKAPCSGSRSLYINSKLQMIMKLKSKHIGGAFSKKKKGVVYGIYDDIPA